MTSNDLYLEDILVQREDNELDVRIIEKILSELKKLISEETLQ